ncbi:hypothetical protein [Ochrobactrum sp. Marseille-Q0166]|uniref:hypothetical protein n=1 Tax=Ochrobactrum sp. Marseille-Q0166 TaxID=2761105 RepID=UPI001FFFAE91|nr:hypothetical protein [Ochrobactrum sp. Marseille-Q0166]
MRLKTRKNDERREAQVRLAFRLQMKHDVAVAEIAQVMGCTEKQYLHWLKGVGLDEKNLIKPSATDTALQRLQTELNKLIDAEELPDKGKAEALMALAKAVKTVNELVSETEISETDIGASVASLAEVRQALIRIDRRIDELAKRRAQEFLERGLDAQSDNGRGQRMAAQGA